MFVYYTARKCFASARTSAASAGASAHCSTNFACTCKIAFSSLVIQITINAVLSIT
jgi:hypothetical protein